MDVEGPVYFYGLKPGAFGSEPWLVKLGKNVHIVSGTNFVTHDGGTLVLRHLDPDLELTDRIVVGDNVYFGMGALVLPGVTIGSNVVVGARSVVTKDVPDNSVVAGVPARIIRTFDEYLDSARKRSLGFGRLQGPEKDKALRAYFAKKYDDIK